MPWRVNCLLRDTQDERQVIVGMLAGDRLPRIC
jgi:hypothetical protein